MKSLLMLTICTLITSSIVAMPRTETAARIAAAAQLKADRANRVDKKERLTMDDYKARARKNKAERAHEKFVRWGKRSNKLG